MSLTLTNLTLTIAGRPLLGPLSLTVEPGQVTTVMGPSGSGKSTLLAVVCGTADAAVGWTGRIELAGRDVGAVAPEARGIGILYQDDLLFPHLTVAENLAFALPRTVKGMARTSAVDAALDEAGLTGFGPRDPATLSGGQRARVALLRALLANPSALLLDEPFAKLDAELRDRFRTFVFDRVKARGLPTLMVTHDASDAAAAGGDVIRLG